MSDREKIKKMLKASENGIITSAQVTEAGLHRNSLQQLVNTVSDVDCMYGETHGRTISTSCKRNTDGEFTRTTLRCICSDIQTEPLQNIL